MSSDSCRVRGIGSRSSSSFVALGPVPLTRHNSTRSQTRVARKKRSQPWLPSLCRCRGTSSPAVVSVKASCHFERPKESPTGPRKPSGAVTAGERWWPARWRADGALTTTTFVGLSEPGIPCVSRDDSYPVTARQQLRDPKNRRPSGAPGRGARSGCRGRRPDSPKPAERSTGSPAITFLR
jgi:hypothetical protein